MSLIEQIVNIFESKLTEVFKREAEDEKYLKQTILGCRFRSFCGITVVMFKSYKPMVSTLALAIAKHREDEHGEDKTGTIQTLSRSLNMDASEVSTSSFWNR